MSIDKIPDPFSVVSKALKCEVSTLNSDSGLNRHPHWDSFGHLCVVMELEEAYKIKIDDKSVMEYQEMSRIIELYNILKNPL